MESSPGLPPAGEVEPNAHARRRQIWVMVGLLLTLVGLALLAVLFPSEPSGLTELLPEIAAGIIALWVGGLLLGMGMGMKRRGRQSPPPS